jgi:hypothetical protein
MVDTRQGGHRTRMPRANLNTYPPSAKVTFHLFQKD